MNSSVWKRKAVEEDDVLSTPEGDNEFLPDQPLVPIETMEIPPGNAPSAYDGDRPSEAEEIADKLSLGQILT